MLYPGYETIYPAKQQRSKCDEPHQCLCAFRALEAHQAHKPPVYHFALTSAGIFLEECSLRVNVTRFSLRPLGSNWAVSPAI